MSTPRLAVAAPLIAAALVLSVAALDPGPTYGRDYAGGDYNVTLWHTPSSESADHYILAAKQCEALCWADDNCCSWTYCTPEAGPSDPERCCLKNTVPVEISATYVPAGVGCTNCVSNAVLAERTCSIGCH